MPPWPDGIGPEKHHPFHARFAWPTAWTSKKTGSDIFGKDASPEARRGKILIATRSWSNPWTSTPTGGHRTAPMEL
jgi:hypothetical protein